MGKKNAEQRCSAENKIKKLCVEQKKGDNKTDVKSNKFGILHKYFVDIMLTMTSA